MPNRLYVIRTALIVALGGFLMGFDASVISGVVRFIEVEFALTKLQLGWAVSSLTLTATLAMMLAGPLSDRFGRRSILFAAAILYAVSAVASALAPTFAFLVAARMIGGLGVGASLIIAPMYIAELAPPELRGRMVSFNQLNIVVGISVAFFTNYLILQFSQSGADWTQALGFAEHPWRWMLGVETLPAVLYFVGLLFVPQSPRWLVMKGREQEALPIMERAVGSVAATQELSEIQRSMLSDASLERASVRDLFAPAMRFVLTIGVVVGILQQITGINAVFFYAPVIFEQSGIGTDASFVQAILVGLVNLVFTVVAILLIDRVGRKPLLTVGLAGIALAMFLLAYGFNQATYTLGPEATAVVAEHAERLQPLVGQTFSNDVAFKGALGGALGPEAAQLYEAQLIAEAISMNPLLILFGILGFVAAFAVSIGPVMWVLFSELFPNRIRGIAISFVGLINSAVSFLVQLVFPWELATLGSATTFLIYGLFAAVGLVFVLRVVPETKGKSLEELQVQLVGARASGAAPAVP
jgi:MFS transporter, SP family, arabinose:H+ symporter